MYNVLIWIINYARNHNVEVRIETPVGLFPDSISLTFRRDQFRTTRIFTYEELWKIKDPELFDNFIGKLVIDFNADCGEATF